MQGVRKTIEGRRLWERSGSETSKKEESDNEKKVVKWSSCRRRDEKKKRPKKEEEEDQESEKEELLFTNVINKQFMIEKEHLNEKDYSKDWLQ